MADASRLFRRGIGEGIPDKKRVEDKVADVSYVERTEKVDQTDVQRIWGDEYVVRFDASVDDSSLVDLIKSPRQRAGYGEEIPQRDLPTGFHPLCESDPGEIVLGYEVVVVLRVERDRRNYQRIV